ncbi:helix-turn-helix domain-containing protein [Streptomyces cinereospinus]|uniref:Helix-turn-helix domain-containing protein n=1 Tax=Streptomyces cinereospinus TaxID=285561 RepID=A0ABV5N597_9ACTN
MAPPGFARCEQENSTGDATVPCYVVQEESGARINARMDVWHMTAMQVFSTDSTGIRLVRTARQARRTDAAPVIAFAVQTRSQGHQDHLDHQRLVAPGQLMLMDLSAPYDYAWSGHGASRCVQIPLDQLTLPIDVVRGALVNLPSSPLYPMLTDHIARLTGDIEDLLGDPASAGLEEITLGLARALIASAARQDRRARAVLAETRVTRIRAYARRHLSEPDLTPARIAAAHHISERYLYKLCAQAGFSLTQWIISRRLEGAREELAHPSSSGRGVAVVARRWGFADPTHFSHRFKAAYGVSPRDWRRMAREEDRPVPPRAANPRTEPR